MAKRLDHLIRAWLAELLDLNLGSLGMVLTLQAPLALRGEGPALEPLQVKASCPVIRAHVPSLL